jgi:VanZ family protein
MLNLDMSALINFMLTKFSSYFDVIKSDTGLLTDSAKVFKNRVSETIDLVKKTPYIALEKPKPLVKTTADKSSNTWLYLGLGAAAAAIGFVVYKNKSNKGM